MSVNLPLDEMTLADKMELMESIWADLSRRPESLPSPDWHRGELQERKRLVEEGKLQFHDWEDAIRELRGELHDDSSA
jgi:hypothetical protein